MPARAMWCSARPRALPPTSTCRRSTAATASSSAARRPTTAAASRSPSAGDVNGDGFADLIVGAPRRRSERQRFRRELRGVRQGRGLRRRRSTCRASTAATASSSSGDGGDDFSGCSVASAGDVNGDGFADLIVGAPARRPERQQSGASYVVFGKARGFAANARPVEPRRQQRLQAQRRRRRTTAAACSVSSAGDVNGDGFADLIVGAAGADAERHDSGASLCGVRQGRAASPPTLDLSTPRRQQRLQASAARRPTTRAASRSSSAGDVNGDGFADLIVGASVPIRTAAIPARAMWCSARPSGFAANLDLSTPRRQQRLHASAARRRTTVAAARSPRRATSTATASPT